MQIWRVWIKPGSAFRGQFTYFSLNMGELMNDVERFGTVGGMSYRGSFLKDEDGETVKLQLQSDRFRVFPLSSIDNIECVTEYPTEIVNERLVH